MKQGRPGAFSQRVGVGLAVGLVAALAIASTALLALHSVRASNQAVTRRLSSDCVEVERLRRAFSEKVASVRGQALSPDPSFTQEVERSRRRFLNSLEWLRGSLTEAPGPELLEAVTRAEHAHELAAHELVAASRAGADRERLEAIFEGRVGPLRQRVDGALGALVAHAQERLERGMRRAEVADRWALGLILVAASLGLVGVALLLWVLLRKLRPLQREAQATEERLRLLVDGVRDYALVLLDAQGRVASWNPGAERIKGWRSEEVLGLSTTVFFPPEARVSDEPEQLLARAARDGRLRIEGWRVRKDGTRFWAEVTLNALREEDGRLKGYAVVTRDVTERRRTQRTQRLFAEAGRLFHQHLDPDLTAAELARMMVPELADGCILFLVTASGRLRPRAVTHVSPEREQLLWEAIRRYPPERDAHQGVLHVLRTGESLRTEVLTRDMLVSGAQDAGHLRLMESLGLRSVLGVALRVGEVSRGVLVLLSSEPERRYTAEDQVLVEELAGRAALALDNTRLFREAQQALELIGVASHDLGNPLNTLQLALQRLKRLDAAAEPRKVREGLVTALRQAQKLGQMLHNLLDLSRLSSGQLALDVGGVDLADLVREVTERHAEQAADAGCSLVVQVLPGVVGRWDRLRLERVVANLLSNALKFGRGRPVEVRVHGEGGRARLVVRDHGEGIPPEAQRRIFDRFEREKTGGKHAGFGLGLYIVRQLVEAHGGTIHVESRPGEGAAFIVELPLTPLGLELDGAPAPH